MATYLVTLVILILLARGFIYLIQISKGQNAIKIGFDKSKWKIYVACFFSGILLTNAVPHFVHGISGEYFPAPFGQYLGKGLPDYLSNVIWGFINIVLGYNLFVLGQVPSPSKSGKIFFFAGILAMGVFLSIVFSHFNQ